MKNCNIQYYRVQGKQKEDKLQWLAFNKGLIFKDIPFVHIIPDKNNNWLKLTENDWDNLLPIIEINNNSIFYKSIIGVNTARDEWVFDYNKINLENKMKYFINKYHELLKMKNINTFNDLSIKWSEQLKRNYNQSKYNEFNSDKIININYRPFIKLKYYSDKLYSDRLTDSQYITFGNNLNMYNKVITITNSDRLEYNVYAVKELLTFQYYMDPAKCLPLYRYTEKGQRIENITDWGLNKFREYYENIYQNEGKTEQNEGNIEQKEGKAEQKISKEDIFHYIYAVLHNPAYRKKYEMNLKREFPRIPFYNDFWKWSTWGEKLMDLHINFEGAEKYPLEIINTELQNEPYKPKLKSNKDFGTIELDNQTTISGIPKEAWEYKLGNRSALEWILDQYKEKKPKDPTIAEKFNIYRFADYKEKVIDLLMRVTTVSVETMRIINMMAIK